MRSLILFRALGSLALAAFSTVPLAHAQEAVAPAAEEAKPKPRPRKPPKPAAQVPPDPAAQAPSAAWPSGATALSETYGDWTMTCTRTETRATCLVLQAQGNARTGKREFAIELKAPAEGRAEGLVLMPHGFSIEPGVTFKLDETAMGKGAPYLTCSQDGCLVPISLPTLATDSMKTAKNLIVLAVKPEAKEPTAITVPLGGFAAAFSRAVAFGG
jgi:invasion protein IalB